MTRTNPHDLEKRIQSYIDAHSGFEPHRDYLSMSHLADCPRKVVREYRDGFPVEEWTHRMAFAGYEMEKNVKQILTDLSELSQVNVEVVASFDSRLKGHLDGLSRENEVVEIKSVSKSQFAKVCEKGKALYKHFSQVQLYMKYGGYREALIVYRCRETYEHKVVHVGYIGKIADELHNKAVMILQHIDEGTLPPCECGECEKVEASHGY